MGRRRDKAVKGDWSLICDVCGFKIKASDSLQRWDGMQVCPADYEERHPQDFLRVGNEDTGVPFTRTESPDVFDGKTYTTDPETITTRYDKGTFTKNNEEI